MTMVKIYGDWCTPCKVLKPIYKRLAASLDPAKVACAQLNSNVQNVIPRITALPTIVFFKGVDEVDRLISSNPAELVQKIYANFGVDLRHVLNQQNAAAQSSRQQVLQHTATGKMDTAKSPPTNDDSGYRSFRSL
jgi:thiol-disulfide isomerase/thioredoxin